MTLRWTAWGPAAIWAGVLFFLSAQPGTDGPPIFLPEEDKVAHVGLYAIFAATLVRAARGEGSGGWRWAPLVLGFVFAVSDEWHQTLVPRRDASVGDLVADTLGLLLGYWLSSLYLTRRTRTESYPVLRDDLADGTAEGSSPLAADICV